MRGSICAFNPAAALHRVFIAPIERSKLQFVRQISSPYSFFNVAAPKLSSQQRRCYAEPAKRRLPRDDEIKAWSVALVNEDGRLEDPRPTYDILQSIDRKTQSLVTVAAGEPGVPPICKIMDKKEMREAEKARAKAARGSGVTTKTIELNWAIDDNDLGHRLKRAKDFLQKGNRVEFMMAAKKRGRQATPEQATELVKRIKDVIGEVEGAKETRAMEGKLLGLATIYVEGKSAQKP
jgi:translation initiation factor IF-3